MESLRLSFEAVTPIFLLMLLGYVLKCMKVAEKSTFDAINSLVFKIFLPVLLFYNIYKTEANQVFDAKLVAFTIISVFSIFIIGLFAVRFITKDNAKRGVMLQGFFRSNYAILGIPLVHYICGEKSGALASLMVAVVIPVFNVLAVISLEIFRGNKIEIKKIIKGIFSNPLIIGCIIGVIFFILKLKLPVVIEKAVSDVSKIASPLAIVILGASFNFSGIKGYFKENLITVSVKLVLVPLVMLSAAALLGFRGEAFACMIVLFGAPVAVSSFAMSQQMGGDEKLSSQVIVISSAACVVTLFVWIFVFGYLGFI